MLLATRRHGVPFLGLWFAEICFFLSILCGTSHAQNIVPADWIGDQGRWGISENWSGGIIPQNDDTQHFVVDIPQGIIAVSPSVVVDSVRFAGTELDLRRPLETTVFDHAKGHVMGSSALRVLGDLIFRSGVNDVNSSAGVSIGGSLRKLGYGSAIFAPFASTGTYPIEVLQGTLSATNQGFGSPEVGTFVATELAVLASVGSDDITLDNADGFLGRGALLNSQSLGTLFGDVYLGDQGSTIGSERDTLRIYGAMHGNDLRLGGRSKTEIRSGEHDYIGSTMIGGTDGRTIVELIENGRLGSSSEIVITPRGQLTLRNDVSELPDRIGDSTALRMTGGELRILASSAGFEESVGPLIVEEGASTLNMVQGLPTLRVQSLSRHLGSTVDFQGALNARFENRGVYHITNAPELQRDILGGWAIADSDFASFDPELGIIPLGDYQNRPKSLNPPNVDGNVFLSGNQVMIGDRHIHSLATETSLDLDLVEHRLTIASGGILFGGNSDRRIANGQLTAGSGAESSELFVHVTGGNSGSPMQEISAAITDNEWGGAVTLIKSGNARFHLSGNNSYTGPTHVLDGTLFVDSSSSIPVRGDITLQSGGLVLDFATTVPVAVRTLTMQNDSFLTAFNAVIDADRYRLEGGSINSVITGDGTMHVETDGVVDIETNNPNYSGAVEIVRGALIAGGSGGVNQSPAAVGTGQITIRPGGMLVHASLGEGNNPQSNSLRANINLVGGDVGLMSPSGLTQWEFHGPWDVVSSESRLLLFDAAGTRTYEEIEVVLHDPVQLHSDSRLSVLGEGAVHFDGGVTLNHRSAVESDASLYFGPAWPMFVGQAVHLAAPQVVIAGEVRPAASEASLTVPSQASLEGPITIGAEQHLSLFSAAQPMTVAMVPSQIISGGGTLQANVVVGAESVLSPGDNGVGVLTLAGTTTIRPDGILRWQVSGPTKDARRSTDLVVTNSLAAAGFSSTNDFFLVELLPITAQGEKGTVDGFDAEGYYAWDVFHAPDATGFEVANLRADAQLFAEFNPLASDHEFVFAAKPGRIELVYRRSADFDGNDTIDSADVDLFCAAYATGNSRSDLDSNKVVDLADLQELIETRIGTLFGDADLDRQVTFSDFVLLANHFAQDGTWSVGDFDCSGRVEFADFIVLANNFGNSISQRTVTVPEPSMFSAVMWTILLLAISQRRNEINATAV